MNIHHEGLSIVLPVVKVEYLEECLDSLINSISRIELQVELLIIKARDVKLPDLYQHEGLEIKILDLIGANYSEAIIHGVENSKFKLISLMNDDDLVSPFRFENQLEILLLGETQLVVTNFKKFGTKSRSHKLNLNPSRRYHHSYLLLGPYGANATWMFQRDWFNKYKQTIEFKKNFDWSCALLSFKDTKLTYISDQLYFYRQHENQITMHQSYRERLFLDMQDELASQINDQFKILPGINTIKALAFPYLRNQVTLQVVKELMLILFKIWSIKESRSFWLLYQTALRILSLVYWRYRKKELKNA